MEIDLPDWSFDAALYICEQRQNKFKNRFYNEKLREQHKNQEYFKHSEGITGYLGDIGAALLLGRDPVIMLEEMVELTDGLAHRDQFDIHYRGWRIDAKIEDYREHHDAVIAGVTSADPYGYRLINSDQYKENKGSTDIYLFGCFNPPMGDGVLLHDVKRVRWMGWTTAEFVETCNEGPFIPKGPRLPAWARQIPHERLRSLDLLFDLPEGDWPAPAPKDRGDDQQTAERIAAIQAEIRAIAK